RGGGTASPAPHRPAGPAASTPAGTRRAAARQAGPVRGIVLPLQPVGWSPEHGGLPGTLSLRADLLADAWIAIARWAARAGVRRLLILNSHGGNPPAIAIAALRLRTEDGVLVPTTHWEDLARPAELAPDGAA